MDGFKRILTEWHDEVVIKAADAHYDAQRYFSRLHTIIGYFAIISTAVASATALKSLADQQPAVLWLIAVASVLGFVFSSLQTRLAYADRARQHRDTAAGYAAVRRRIFQALELPPATDAAREALASKVRVNMDKLSAEAPELPAKFVRVFPPSTPLQPKQHR
jgi:hypothetical protein